MSIDYKYISFVVPGHLDATEDEAWWVAVPIHWVDDIKKLMDSESDTCTNVRLFGSLEKAQRWATTYYKGCVGTECIDALYGEMYRLYMLMDEGYINKKCVEAFQAKEGAE